MFLESVAFASGGAAGQPASPGWLVGVMNMVPFIAIFAIFYFLLIRPQQKKQNELNELISNLKKGDKVVTQGGLYGVVSELNEEWVALKLNDKTEVKFARNAITGLRK